MADSKNAAPNASSGKPEVNLAPEPAVEVAKAAPRPQNPALKMMGIPNIRWRLPSRNWLIFLTIVGSWTGAWYYDRREQRRMQRKWCDAVKHLAKDTLPANQLQRKMTIFLAAPPAEGVMTIREHFHEYVKPVLVAAAMDWDAVEGRREGDVRAQLATKIRRARRRAGERGREGDALERDEEDYIQEIRDRLGVKPSDQIGGDVVIGRHTWKEYVRGTHEGWLGPLDEPQTIDASTALDAGLNGNGNGNDSEEKPPRDRPHDIGSIPTFAAEKVLERATHLRHKDEAPPDPAEMSAEPTPASNTADSSKGADRPPEEQKEGGQESPEKRKTKQPPPFISTADYPSASLPPSIPTELTPSITIPFPHILGFRNTPIRMYRFLTRRYLADDIGRQTAAAVFAAYRPFHSSQGSFSPDVPDDGASPAAPLDSPNAAASAHVGRTVWEQEFLLKQEESEWHKSVRKREEGDDRERTWIDPMVLDDRIASRMRRFELSREEEARANRIGEGKEVPKQRVYDIEIED